MTMIELNLNEYGVLLELLLQHSRVCDSDYYEALYSDKPRRAALLKKRFEVMDSFYDRFLELGLQTFGVSAELIDDMRLEGQFEKELIKATSLAKRK